MPIPEIHTPRLWLRPFALTDARRVEELAGHADVAAGSLLIPHPYPRGLAARWIESHEGAWRENRALILAVCRAEEGVIGSISLLMEEQRQHQHLKLTGLLGYWLGRPYWGQGLMTEAARALIEFGFCELGLDRIEAQHLPHNLASGRVMRKSGLCYQDQIIETMPDGRSIPLYRYCLDYPDWLASQ